MLAVPTGAEGALLGIALVSVGAAGFLIQPWLRRRFRINFYGCSGWYQLLFIGAGLYVLGYVILRH